MAQPIRHVHEKKRLYSKLEKFFHHDPLKKLMDKFIFIVGIVWPMTALPQVYKIYSAKSFVACHKYCYRFWRFNLQLR